MKRLRADWQEQLAVIQKEIGFKYNPHAWPVAR